MRNLAIFSLPMNRLLAQRLGANTRFGARNFQSSSRMMNNVFGTPKDGVYSNIPFPIKTKTIPFALPYWGVLGFFFAFPFLTTYWHLKKAGNI